MAGELGSAKAREIHERYVVPLLTAFFTPDRLYKYHSVTIDSVDQVDKSATFHYKDGTVESAKHGVIVPLAGEVWMLEECKAGWKRLIDSFRNAVVT